jgi:hypothetical protein
MYDRFLFTILLGLLTACAANIRDTDLLVSNTFLLPPTAADTVFIQNRNASDNPQVTLSDLESRLNAKGYRVVKDRQSAQFIVFTNIVYCNQTEPDLTAEAIVSGGYGSGITPGQDSAADISKILGGQVGKTAGGIASRVLGSINKFFKDGEAVEGVVYACVGDLDITDRGKATDEPAPHPTPGSPPPAGVYQIRVGATVTQKKFDEKEATLLVQQRLSAALAGYL